MLRIRKSGLRSKNPQISMPEMETEEHISYRSLSEDYSGLIKGGKKKKVKEPKKPRIKKQAYVITYVNVPNLFYITFQTFQTRDTGKHVATKYFTENTTEINASYYKYARRRRVPQLDKYADTERVPIEEIMKLGVAYRCNICGEGLFKYEDIENEKCFVIRDEGDINPFTDGIIVCPKCNHEYFS